MLFSELCKIIVNKVTFVGFREAIAQIAPTGSAPVETLLPGVVYPLATMSTVLWQTLRCCITLHCVMRLELIMSWPSMFLFGSAILHANNSLKNVSSEFVLFCKKAVPLHFIQATPQLVLSALIGNFANKVVCFSRIVSHPIAKSHVKPWTVREHDTTWIRLFLPFVFEELSWYKTPAKSLNKFFRRGPNVGIHHKCVNIKSAITTCKYKKSNTQLVNLLKADFLFSGLNRNWIVQKKKCQKKAHFTDEAFFINKLHYIYRSWDLVLVCPPIKISGCAPATWYVNLLCSWLKCTITPLGDTVKTVNFRTERTERIWILKTERNLARVLSHCLWVTRVESFVEKCNSSRVTIGSQRESSRVTKNCDSSHAITGLLAFSAGVGN